MCVKQPNGKSLRFWVKAWTKTRLFVFDPPPYNLVTSHINSMASEKLRVLKNKKIKTNTDSNNIIALKAVSERIDTHVPGQINDVIMTNLQIH